MTKVSRSQKPSDYFIVITCVVSIIERARDSGRVLNGTHIDDISTEVLVALGLDEDRKSLRRAARHAMRHKPSKEIATALWGKQA